MRLISLSGASSSSQHTRQRVSDLLVGVSPDPVPSRRQYVCRQRSCFPCIVSMLHTRAERRIRGPADTVTSPAARSIMGGEGFPALGGAFLEFRYPALRLGYEHSAFRKQNSAVFTRRHPLSVLSPGQTRGEHPLCVNRHGLEATPIGDRGVSNIIIGLCSGLQ